MGQIPMVFWILAVLILVVSIAWHEFCHFLAARLVGMKIKSVHVGLPYRPMIKSHLGGTEVYWSPYLVGGGVKIDDQCFENSDWWRRLLVAVTGPVGNLLLAMLVAVVMFGLDRGVEISQAFASASVIATGQVVSFQVPPNQIVGPMGLVGFMATVIRTDFWLGMAFCLIALNISLAVTNLLPLPALDGGLILTALIAGVWKAFGAPVVPWVGVLDRKLRQGTYYVLLCGVLLLLLKDAVVMLVERMGWL